MQPTRTSLLRRLQDPQDADAWREFEGLYHDLVVQFCRSRGLQQVDAEDVAQAVFFELARVLPSFTLDRARGRFRDYLFRCVRNAISHLRSRPKHGAASLDSHGAPSLADDRPSPADAEAWEEEWTAHHYRLAMDEVRRSFDPRSVSIFERFMAGAGVAEVAHEFGLTADAVYKVRRRIRERMEQLIAEQIRAEDGVDEAQDFPPRVE